MHFRTRVKVYGTGGAYFVSEARRQCKERCPLGVNDFKRFKCPQLCGRIRPLLESRTQVCVFCAPNVNYYINMCKSLIDAGVRQCVRGCDTAEAAWDGPKVYLASYSEEIIKKIPQ